MIDFLRGKIVYIEEDHVVLDVHGVGYRVFSPNPESHGAAGQEAMLHTHHHVREDAILLYGFSSRDERALFRKLLDVGGIGPRVAIGILSVGRPEEIVTAIQQENVVLLMKLPGIGKKTAQRIILDLKDKLAGFSSIPGSPGELSSVPTEKGSIGGSMNWLEAKEALLALGYSEMEAERAGVSIRERITPEMNVDAVIKLALKELYTNG